MNKLVKKLKKLIKDSRFLMKEYGFNYAALYFFEHCTPPILRRVLRDKRIRVVKNYVRTKYSIFLKRFDDFSETQEENKNRVWIYWGQGFDSAPELVQMCVKSVKKNIVNAEVVLLSEKTYQDFLSLPNYILEKYRKGIISATHFSDILRCGLLAKYGGMWLDATVFVAGKIEDYVWYSKFWTIRLPYDETIGSVSYYRWNTAVMKGDSSIFSVMYQLWLEYWKEHNYVIDYFLLDYFLDLLYEKKDNIKELIDAVPLNNFQEFALAPKLNSKFSEKEWHDLLKDTHFFKLQRRSQYIENVDSKITFYGYLKKIYVG